MAEMDRGNKLASLIASGNKKMDMDLKEIIREHALCHLPAKAIRRFTGVCRDWRNHVASPFFSHNQSLLFRDLSGFLCLSPSRRIEFLALDPLAYGIPDPSLSFLPEPVDVRCSSNGLLCCQGRTGYRAYYVCNPATGKWKKLPKPTAEHGADPAVVLIFEPALLNFVAEYKLVCVFPSDLDGLEFEIYSSTEGSWRISAEICFGKHSVVPGSGVYAGGVVYWKTSSQGLLAFDLASERTTFRNCYSWPIGQVNGKLCSASIFGMRLSITEVGNTYSNTMRMGAKKRSRPKVVNLSLATSSEFQYGDASVIFVGYDAVVMRSRKSFDCSNLRTKEFQVTSTAVDYNRKRMVPYVNSLVEL